MSAVIKAMSLGQGATAALAAVLVCSGGGTGSIAVGQDAPVPWSEMEKFFAPPEQYRGRLGDYRSLMKFDDGHDMHELHALMAPRPFLVSGGAQDRPEHWTALNHAIALDDFLGQTGRVAMTMRDGHAPTPSSNAEVWACFEHFLKGH